MRSNKYRRFGGERVGRASQVAIVFVAMLLFMVLPAPSGADEHTEVPVTVVPGYHLIITMEGRNIFLPSTPLASLNTSEELPEIKVPIVAGPVDRRNACTIEEEVGTDEVIGEKLVECPVERQANVTAPCEGAIAAIEAVPVAGPILSEQLRAKLEQLDDFVDEMVIPVLAGAGVDYPWDQTLGRVVQECETIVPSLVSLVGAGPQNVTVNLPEQVGACLPALVCEQVPVNRTVNAGIQGQEHPVVTNTCSVRGAWIDCGNVTVPHPEGNLSFNPFRPIHDVLDNLPNNGSAYLYTNDMDRDTPYIGEFNYTAESSAAGHCILPGWPSGRGFVSGPPMTTIEVREQSGGQLPFGVHEISGAALATFAEKWNELSEAVDTAWQDLNMAAVTTVESTWPTLGPYAEPGHPEDATCQTRDPDPPRAPEYEP